MSTNEKAIAVRDAMEQARRVFNDEVRAANEEILQAASAFVPSGDATENWNSIEAHSKYRNRIEAAAFALRLAFLKASGRRE